MSGEYEEITCPACGCNKFIKCRALKFIHCKECEEELNYNFVEANFEIEEAGDKLI